MKNKNEWVLRHIIYISASLLLSDECYPLAVLERCSLFAPIIELDKWQMITMIQKRRKKSLSTNFPNGLTEQTVKGCQCHQGLLSWPCCNQNCTVIIGWTEVCLKWVCNDYGARGKTIYNFFPVGLITYFLYLDVIILHYSSLDQNSRYC